MSTATTTPPILKKTSERGSPDVFESEADFLIHLRHIAAYRFAEQLLTSGQRVLEIGCGEGYGANRLSAAGVDITGIDVAEQVVQHANRKYGSPQCHFVSYLGDTIPFADESFDAVVTFQVIEHVEDDHRFVAEAHRVLRSGGVFVVTTPTRDHRLRSGQAPWNTFHVREYDATGLTSLLATAFDDPDVAGIFARDDIQQIELDRVRRIRRVVDLDRWNLRRFLPLDIVRGVANAVRKSLFAQRSFDAVAASTRYSADDFRISHQRVAESLDLWAVCRKS